MLRSLFFDHIAQTSPTPHIFEVSRGEGIYLYDMEGQPFIDLISGISVSHLGHGHPEIIQAIQSQSERYLHTMVYGEHIQSPQVKLAEKLVSVMPESLDKVYFVSTGSECVEAAIKICKKYTGRYDLVACRNAYHGSSHGPLSLMSDEYYSGAYRPLVPVTRYIVLNDLDSLDIINSTTAAVFLETIQGEAGIRIPTYEFMQALRKKCTEVGALLVLDEIQAGMGRTGMLFGFEHYDIIPDVLLLSKAFGGGMPLGAIVCNQSVMRAVSDNPILGHITTFGGHPVSCAAGLAALQILTSSNLIKQVPAKSKIFLEELDHPQLKEIRAVGFLIAIDLGSEEKVQQIVQHAREHHVLIDWFLYDAQSIRLSPPLIITEEQIKEVCRVLRKGFDLL